MDPAVDVAAALTGAMISASSCKSRSASHVLKRGGIFLCGSLTAAALRKSSSRAVAAAAAAGLASLLALGRWDNARAEVAPRWEPHGRGASGRLGELWAAAQVWLGGEARRPF